MGTAPRSGAARRWEGAPERLDRALAELGLARSRSHAGELVAAGSVLVDGEPAPKSGVRVRSGAELAVREEERYVSRGAHKLVAALDAFGIDPRDRLALDLGASTGGFTQVLLERGAREVVALDVGRDQLAPEIREDVRVRVVEGRNARYLDAEGLAELTGVREAPSLVVADLSFISLTLVLPAIARCTVAEADAALLIKPQFEVGRVRDGVVTDPALWARAIERVLATAAETGFEIRGLERSPIAGGDGNREFLVHLVRRVDPMHDSVDRDQGFHTPASASAFDPQEWEGRVRELCAPEVGARYARRSTTDHEALEEGSGE